MAEQEAPEFTRTCAWTGEDTAGKHYELKSTEGTELVSEAALKGAAGGEGLAELRAELRAMHRRLAVLEKGPAGGAPRATRTPGQRKAPAGE